MLTTHLADFAQNVKLELRHETCHAVTLLRSHTSSTPATNTATSTSTPPKGLGLGHSGSEAGLESEREVVDQGAGVRAEGRGPNLCGVLLD